MSRVVVNEIQAKVGNDISFNDAAKIDTLKGKTTAGSISVQGEGSNTTNLQQGLAKSFLIYEMEVSSPTAADSFNHTSITDNAQGYNTITLSLAMSSINYVTLTGYGRGASGTAYANCQTQMNNSALEQANTTTTYAIIGIAYNASQFEDAQTMNLSVLGDLA